MKSHNVGSEKDTTTRLTVSGIMIALSTVLSFIKFSNLPYGGAVTLFSFVPVLLVGYSYGLKWGIGAGLVHGVLQAVFGVSGAVAGAGFKLWQVAFCACFDYVFAFTALGLSGVLKGKIKNTRAAFTTGSFLACVIKYLCHVASGYVLFGGYAEWYFTDPESSGAAFGAHIMPAFSGQGLALVYSFIYNATFMIPETVITLVMVSILVSVSPVKTLCETE